MVLVGTRFSIGLLMQPGNRAGQLTSCPARREVESDNWSVVRFDFLAVLVVRWKNAFPQEPLVVGSRTRRVWASGPATRCITRTWPVVRLDFPAVLVVRWKNVPTRTIGRGFNRIHPHPHHTPLVNSLQHLYARN